jgi:protein KRI1
MLSDSESDVSLHDLKLTINEHYAKAFEYKKEREELEKRRLVWYERPVFDD